MSAELNELAMSKLSREELSQTTPSPNNNAKTSAEMWKEFADNTTLHGIRYVFMKRHIVIRLIWLVLLLTSGGYYIFTVYKAFTKFYSRPVNTVISTKHVKEMDFPAVTVCSLNSFANNKLVVTDDNPLFAFSGLNISACAVTSVVRGNRPCGLSLVCCCVPSADENVYTAIPNCTSEYREDLLDVIKRSSHRFDIEAFSRHYTQDINSLTGPTCTFGWDKSICSTKDFSPMVTQWGMCHTFNSGAEEIIKKVDSGGVSSGLNVILDAQTWDYSQGKFSEGFKVLIHQQGEYVDEWEGINVGPGQHAVIALSQKRVGVLSI